MGPVRFFDVGSHPEYFDTIKNRAICEKVASKCYLPANALMLELLQRYPGQFKIAYSISGVALEQFKEYTPAVLESFQKLAATGDVEMISETYYHSLASLKNPGEFKEQIRLHQSAIQQYFGLSATTFRNTELIYANQIASQVEELGFTAMLTEGVDRILGWRSPNFVYQPKNGHGMKLLLKNYALSDDIAFRFSQSSWESYPLTAEKFAHWIHQAANDQTVNLFMDYETIGEHQWEATGIFDFFRSLPEAVLANPHFSFATPSEVAAAHMAVDRVDVPEPISWADTERDTSAWLGNPMQDGAIDWLYSFDTRIKQVADPSLLHTWRKLQTSDHFYYMCTKWWADGDVHKYFSVYDTPHESYVLMNNILTDLEIRLTELQPITQAAPTISDILPPKRPQAIDTNSIEPSSLASAKY